MNAPDDDPGLSEHDRRAIADIRRELDAEFQAPPPARSLPPASPPRPRRRRVEPRGWSTMALILAFLVGAVSSAAGVFYTLVTLHPPTSVIVPRGNEGQTRTPPLPAPPAAVRPQAIDVPATAPGLDTRGG